MKNEIASVVRVVCRFDIIIKCRNGDQNKFVALLFSVLLQYFPGRKGQREPVKG